MLSRLLKLCVGPLTLGAILVTAACGGGGGTTQLRVLQASPNEPSVDTLIDSVSVNTNLGYGANTGYLSVKAGSRHLQIEPSGSSNFIINQTVSVANSDSYTFIVAGLSPNITGMFLTDNTTAPASGTAMIRVINVAPSMGTADVYIVASGSSLSGAPTIPSLAFEQASSYQSFTIPTTTGTTTTTSFEVFFTQPGTTLAFLDTGPINIASGQNRTVVALNNLAGGIMFTTLSDLD